MRKVRYARTHQGLHVPGAGDLGNVFPPQSKTLSNLEMTIDELGLHISFEYKKLKNEILVPSANVVLASLFPEEAPIRVASGAVVTGTFGGGVIQGTAFNTYPGVEDNEA